MLIRSVTGCTLRIVLVFCVSLGGDTVHVSAERCDSFCLQSGTNINEVVSLSISYTVNDNPTRGLSRRVTINFYLFFIP